MGNQPAVETAENSSGDEMQAAIDADLVRVGSDPNSISYRKENLQLRNPRYDYIIMETLGTSSKGPSVHYQSPSVYKIKDKQTKVKYAMQEIDVSKTPVAVLQREMAVALAVDHPYMLGMEACYQHKNILSAILPIMQRPAETPDDEPDVFSWVLNKGAGCSELEGAKITHHVASALKYLHEELNTCHCDLKPENVLVGPAGLDGLKVTGNGLACVVDPNEGRCVSVPPIFHMARETLNRGIGDGNYDGKVPSDYDGKVDVFSLGVILYSVMVLDPPFASRKEIHDSTPAIFTASEWRQVSNGCKDLCQKMLQHDPEQRCSINEVLAHPWLAEHGF